MSSNFHCFHWNVICPFLWLLLRFSLCLWFSALLLWDSYYTFLGIYCPWDISTSWLCGLISLECLGKLSSFISSNISIVPVSLSFPSGTLKGNSETYIPYLFHIHWKKLPQSARLYVNFFSLLCCNFVAYFNKNVSLFNMVPNAAG